MLFRARRIRGRVEALEDERGCAEILQRIAAGRRTVKRLMLDILEEHIETHLAGTEIGTDAERRKDVEAHIEVMRTCLR